MHIKTKLLLIVSLAACFLSLACNRTTNCAAPQSARHYHLKGKVVSVDNKGKMANIDSEAIPGFMDAMTMPYQIKPEGELDRLHPGDSITADLIVQDEKAWLENVAVVPHTK